MIDVNWLAGFLTLILKLLAIIGSPFLALLIRRWIICHYDLKKTIVSTNAQIEIERIRAGISQNTSNENNNNSSLRINRDST